MPAPGSLIGFIPITDGDRARSFYSDLLGLEFVQDDGFAIALRSKQASEAKGNMIRLVRMSSVVPAQFTILGWEVDVIEADVHHLAAAGITFLRYPWFRQDELGIWTAPNGNKVAWFKDPDGNVLSISQH